MRRLIAAGIIALLVVGICITHHLTIKNSIEVLQSHTEAYANALEKKDTTSLQNTSARLTEDWKRHRQFLSLFVNHTMIEELDVSVENLYSYTEIENFELAFVELGALRKRIKKMETDASIHLESVF